MENRSYLGSITKYRLLGHGSNANVFHSTYFDSDFAYKEFWSKKYVNAIIDIIIPLTKNCYDTRFTFPYEFIYEKPTDGLFQGYIMFLLYNYDRLSKESILPTNEKIRLLNKARELVEIYHNQYNHLHADLAPWNFMYNKEQDTMILSDLDTSVNLKNKFVDDIRHANYVIEYAKSNGIDKDLDIFLFNLSTFAYLNNCDIEEVIPKIKEKQYGVIDSTNAKEIFESYKNFEVPKTIKKEYVIDYLK